MRSPSSSRETPPVQARRPIGLAALRLLTTGLLAPCLLTMGLLAPCLLAVGLLSTGVAAQIQPEVLKDLNPTPVPALVREHPIVLFGPHAYFPGFASRTGEELYRAGTTSNSLQLLIDAHSGRGSGHPFALTPMGGKLYFMVDDGTHGFELWSTDGTNTLLVKDVYPGIASCVVPNDKARESMGVLSNVLYFAAEDGTNGYGLWRSDGTAAGTKLVKALGPSVARQPFEQWTVANGFGIFLARNSATGNYDLWQTDGTSGGTKRLRTLVYRDNLPLQTPYKLHAVGKKLFITGLDTLLLVVPGKGFTTIISLRTATGIVHSGFGSVPDPLSQKGVFLFSGGTYLWRSDGTVKGTLPFYPSTGLGVLNAFEQEPAQTQNRMVFFGFDLKHGEEPWITDGTSAGTHLMADLNPGPPHSTMPSRFRERHRVVTDGTRFYFAASNGKVGHEVWETDGTANGTRLVADINPGAAGSNPRSMVGLPTGGVAFVAEDKTGTKLFMYDPRTAKVRIAAANFHSFPGRTAASRVLGLHVHQDRAYFAGSDGTHGSELWVSDGTPAGTKMVKDLQTGAGSSLRHHDLNYGPDWGRLDGISAGSFFYFNAYEKPGRLAMFRTDGTAAGTTKIRDLALIGGGGWPLRGVAIGVNLYFHGYEAGTGEGLFVMSTLTHKPVRLSTTQPGRLYRLGKNIVFTDGFPPALKGVYVTDGTASGTKSLAKFGRFVADPFLFAKLGKSGFFSMMHQGGVLWRTDGTLTGTSFVRVASIRGMVPVDGTLWTIEERTGGTYLRKGDGTTAGTSDVAKVPAIADQLFAVGTRLYFTAFVGQNTELWTSDGTATGTKLVMRYPAVDGKLAEVVDLRAAGERRLYFRVTQHRGLGGELWVTDGTPSGTKPVTDIHRGPGGANGKQFALVNGKLMFLGNDGRHGSLDGDLYVMDSNAVSYGGGAGCAFDGFVPELGGTDPILGGKVDITLRAAARKPAMFSLGFESPIPLALPRACRIYPTPGRGFTTSIATDATGRWALKGANVPNIPGAHGVRMVGQAAVASASVMPFGADFSNCAVFVFGN